MARVVVQSPPLSSRLLSPFSMGKLTVETVPACLEHVAAGPALSPSHVFCRTLFSPLNSPPSLFSPSFKKPRAASVAAVQVSGPPLPELPEDVWGRILEFLTTRTRADPCASGDEILDTLHGLVVATTTVGQVCQLWRGLTRRSAASSASSWHSSIFGTAGTAEDLAERVSVLRSYSLLSDEMQRCQGGRASVERRRVVRARMQAALRGMLGMRWRLQMEFAGLFWNHASPPVDELSRLEAYCHSILGKPAAKAPAAKPRQDGSGEEEDLTTTVASAMQDPSLIHEFDASKFIVLHMDNAGDAKRQKKQQGGAVGDAFEVVLDEMGPWRRDSSLSFKGRTQVLRAGVGGAGSASSTCLLNGLPWDVHLELGNASGGLVPGKGGGGEKDVFCLLSLSNYTGQGTGTELLLLGRLPHLSFATRAADDDYSDDDQDDGEACSCGCGDDGEDDSTVVSSSRA